jgi:hypothetical protein
MKPVVDKAMDHIETLHDPESGLTAVLFTTTPHLKVTTT